MTRIVANNMMCGGELPSVCYKLVIFAPVNNNKYSCGCINASALGAVGASRSVKLLFKYLILDGNCDINVKERGLNFLQQ